VSSIDTRWLGGFAVRHGFVLVILAVYLFFSVAAPTFFGVANLIDIFHVTAPMMIVASGMAVIVISGKLDISVGSTAYVASAIFALLMRHTALPLFAGWGAALAAGLLLGAINSSIVVFLRVNSLIATLGTMIAFRGFGLSLTNGGLIEMPDPIKPLGNILIGPVFLDTLIASAIVVAVHLIHRWTNFGRQLTAIGNNEEVARRIGIAVDRRVFASFILSGLLAAVAGVIYTMQVAVNTSKIGEGMEFTAIAVVVVGGISLFGGRGNILTAVILGSLTFQIIRSGLQHLGADPYSYRLVEGVVIFVAMYVDALKSDHAGTWRLRRQDQYDGLERLTSGNAPK
jgi:ribose/xylose/arabinose/galactoside ABC-type transport system permease subunit